MIFWYSKLGWWRRINVEDEDMDHDDDDDDENEIAPQETLL